jgi:hypothetical protein
VYGEQNQWVYFKKVRGYTRPDKIRSEVIRKELEISALQDVRSKYKQNWINISKEWTTPNFRNMPSTTNLEGEEIVDVQGKDGKASMPEEVKRPKPWRRKKKKKKKEKKKMMMIMIFQEECSPEIRRRVLCLNQSQGVQTTVACFLCQVQCRAHHLSGCCAFSPLLCSAHTKLLAVFSVPFFCLRMT